ncbi:MAG: hypothetical protein LC124_00700 [Ignavibacteriales bacterium]|nr:hypothetical protein [Gammaproteobacteria bacterium]MCZ2267350.1 hypothetical protein [Ignavibacteriales bacterium]
MADVTLSDGREITFDLTRISLREYRAIFDNAQPQTEEDATLAKVCGMTVDEYLDLSYLEWRRLMTAFFEAARKPLASPN